MAATSINILIRITNLAEIIVYIAAERDKWLKAHKAYWGGETDAEPVPMNEVTSQLKKDVMKMIQIEAKTERGTEYEHVPIAVEVIG